MNKDPYPSDAPEAETSVVGDSAARATADAYAEATASADVSSQVAGAATQEPDLASDQRQATPEELAVALAAARAEAEENRNQHLRARAEQENLKRRHTAELEKAHKFALDGFVRELLQVRDSLELGYAAAMDQATDVDKLREGTELTLKLLRDVMDKFGVTTLDPLDQPFDPAFHQAISTQPRSDVPPNTVVAVVQKGYSLNGRLMRPALVLVSQQGS